MPCSADILRCQYLAFTLGDAKEVTPAINKTLDPEWNERLELPVVGPQSGLLEVICWDKDRFGKDYMGQFDVALEEMFAHGKTAQEVRWYRASSVVAGLTSDSQNGTSWNPGWLERRGASSPARYCSSSRSSTP